jgi:hypothetical protein
VGAIDGAGVALLSELPDPQPARDAHTNAIGR